MKLADARWLFVLAPLFAAWLGWLWYQGRRSGQPAATFSSLEAFADLRASWAVRLRPWVVATRYVAVALLLGALARPVASHGKKALATDGLHIILALDTSGSMRALDLDAERSLEWRRTRLEVVRDVVTSFVQARVNDAVGLVVFGSFAFTQAPLTLDHALVAKLVERLEIGVAGEQTAIGDALVTAVKRLKDDKAKSRVVVLLTDGRSNTGSVEPEEAARLAKAYGVKVYTIGAARQGRAPMVVQGQLFYEDVDLDEETLTAIADTTGGKYYRAEDATALARIYADIDTLEKDAIDAPEQHELDERYPLLVAPALVLLCFEALLLSTRLRTLP